MVRFEVLKETSMKMAVYRDFVPCSFVEIDRRFRGIFLPPYRSEVEGSKRLFNIDRFLPDYMRSNIMSVIFIFFNDGHKFALLQTKAILRCEKNIRKMAMRSEQAFCNSLQIWKDSKDEELSSNAKDSNNT